MRCACHRHSLYCIVPPYMLDKLANSSNPATRKLAIDAIASGADARATRRVMQAMPAMAAMAAPAAGKHRLVYDVKHGGLGQLPGKLVRSEGQAATQDVAVNEAYNHSGTTYDFYRKLFDRNSLDGNGLTLVSSVHLGTDLNNAYWTGLQMAYGDGDGALFVRFTKSLDVVAHELTHGVITHECNLAYRNQSGALNEHFADVFGVLVKQWKKKQTAAKADWLIGADIIGPQSTARALRDMGPGKAYENDPEMGTDPQPKHMKHFYKGTQDYGGVHINSGIPNHAFYLFARRLGGSAWNGAAAAIWYDAMRQLSVDSVFVDMVRVTLMIAVAKYGADSATHNALKAAWKDVGL